MNLQSTCWGRMLTIHRDTDNFRPNWKVRLLSCPCLCLAGIQEVAADWFSLQLNSLLLLSNGLVSSSYVSLLRREQLLLLPDYLEETGEADRLSQGNFSIGNAIVVKISLNYWISITENEYLILNVAKSDINKRKKTNKQSIVFFWSNSLTWL